MWKACSPGGIPLSESLSKTPAGVCKRETVPTSWRLASRSSAVADWAAAGRTHAVANEGLALTMPAPFRMFMPWSPIDAVPRLQPQDRQQLSPRERGGAVGAGQQAVEAPAHT